MMTTILIVILFILLCISFYFIALLYMKISKYDDLEIKQRKLMDEMDDSIAAYLAELKDENDRLLDELTKKNVELKIPKTPIKAKTEETASTFIPKRNLVPKNVALKSYHSGQKVPIQQESAINLLEPKIVEVTEDLSDRTRAIRLHEAGESIEEIAKTLGKGKTEIELILKFK